MKLLEYLDLNDSSNSLVKKKNHIIKEITNENKFKKLLLERIKNKDLNNNVKNLIKEYEN